MEFWTAIWQSIVLGTVQGLTEFLPVSSSGHLLFLHAILGADFGGNEMFVDIMLHFGTLIAVLIVMRKQILALFRKPFQTLIMLIAATIPAGLIGFLFEEQIDGLFHGEGGILWLGVCFLITAVMLLVCEYVSKNRKKVYPLGWRSSIPMGCMQALALFPGISRSGSTITAGVLFGAEKEDVANFSFLMSIPIILGSVFLNGIDIVREPAILTEVGACGWIGLAVGIVCAAAAGYFAMKFMLRIIAKADYKWFSLYLTLLAAVCISLSCAGVL